MSVFCCFIINLSGFNPFQPISAKKSSAVCDYKIMKDTFFFFPFLHFGKIAPVLVTQGMSNVGENVAPGGLFCC